MSNNTQTLFTVRLVRDDMTYMDAASRVSHHAAIDALNADLTSLQRELLADDPDCFGDDDALYALPPNAQHGEDFVIHGVGEVTMLLGTQELPVFCPTITYDIQISEKQRELLHMGQVLLLGRLLVARIDDAEEVQALVDMLANTHSLPLITSDKGGNSFVL